MRQAIIRPSRSLVRAGGGSLPNVLHHRARRSSLSRDRRFSTSARISVSFAFFMRCLGFVPEGIQVSEAASRESRKRLAVGCAASRGFAVRLALAAFGADDAIHALAVLLFRDEGQAKLLANRAGKESPHRMLLPPGLLHDRRDRRPLRSAQQRNHVGLLGICACPGRFGLVVARFAGLALLCPLGGRLWFAGRRIRRFVLHPDRLKAPLRDAQGARTILVIATPNRQRGASANLFDHSRGQELGDDLLGGTAGQIRRRFKGAIVALRSRGQQQQLGLGQFHGILHSVGDDDCRRHHRSPALAMKPAGQDPATRPSGLVEPSHTTAQLPPKSQSFLDHLIAGFWPTGSSNNPDAAEQSANTAPSRAPGASRLAQVLRCSGVMSRKHSRTSIAYRSPKQSDRARDGRGVDAGSGVVDARRKKTRVRPSFLRTAPAKNPRTECCCHPVSFMIAAIVAPCGRLSSAIMLACLVSARARAGSAWSSPVLFRGLLGDLLVLPCFARWAAGFSVGSPAAASVGSCSTRMA